MNCWNTWGEAFLQEPYRGIFNNMERQFHKRYFKIYTGFLARTPDPPGTIFRERKVFICQQTHVAIGNTRITGKQEHISHMIKNLIMERCCHNPIQFFGGEIFLFRFRMYRFISDKREYCYYTVSNSFSDNCFQLDGKIDYCA